mgnify:CR=1 FL=1
MSVRDSVCTRKLEIPSQKREVSRRILADLGEWFGIPDATESYIDKSSTLPFWAAFDGMVAPLCVAALNTLPEEASARVFAKVLDTALGGSRTDSDFLVPTTDLSSLLPEPALRQVAVEVDRMSMAASDVTLDTHRVAATVKQAARDIAEAVDRLGAEPRG